jgi:hypothetical protein
MDRHRACDSPFAERVVDRGTKNTKFSAGCPRGPISGRDEGSTRLPRHVGNGSSLPKGDQCFDRRCDAPRRSDLRAALLGIVGQNVGYEDLRWVSRSACSGSGVNEFGECDFSLFAICSARAALPAAA